MPILATTATSLVAGLHGYILVLEAFLWTTPRALRAFRMTPAFAEQTRTMAANQGLYNGFLAAGLAWAVAHPDAAVGKQLQAFFLGCVAVAGVVGAATANKRILFIQTVPAVIAGALVALGV